MKIKTAKPSRKAWLLRSVFGLVVLAAAATSQAQFQGHYPAGVEGLKAGTLPPPGIYLRDYTVFYSSGRLNDRHGDKIHNGFDAFVFVNAIRPIWITPLTVCGGHYGMDVLAPIFYRDVKAGGGSDAGWNLGDIFVEPITLSWHWQRADFSVGYGFWAPTGEDDLTKLDSPGLGFWSHMFTIGGTWYPEETKKWSVSALMRYELHTENTDLHITPGDTLSLEWGIGRAIWKNIEAGVVGYYQQQTNEDSGKGKMTDALDHVISVGPEVSAFCPQLKMFASLRYLYEVEAEDRPQGHTVTLTLTKPF